MSKYRRTFRIDKLYHKLMKPHGISGEFRPDVISALLNGGFITIAGNERYSETDKMEGGEHKEELYEILDQFKPEQGAS